MVAIESTPRARPKRSDSVFFPLMAIAMALVVFVGFAPTYYLREQFNGPPLNLLRMVHGAAFTGWIALLVTQTGLIAANRRDRVATSVHVINGVNSSTVQKTISELPVASVNAPAT